MTGASVLVTGGAGYIGSHACKALAAAGYRPIAFYNLSLGHRWAVRWGPLIEADLLDGAAIAAALREHQVTAVIHFAASAYVGDSMRNPAAYYQNNVLTTLKLLSAMLTAGVKNFVFSSSCSVYGNPTRIPIDETHPTTPLSPYAQTKLDCENALRWFGLAYGLRWITLRYFNAAGADPEGEIGEDHEPETRLIPGRTTNPKHDSYPAPSSRQWQRGHRSRFLVPTTIPRTGPRYATTFTLVMLPKPTCSPCNSCNSDSQSRS
jgi:UDP-arabinose 4-epimerase